MKLEFRILIVSLLVALVAIPGVFATWQYAQGVVKNRGFEIGLQVNEFIFKPEDVLPDEEANELHGNHMVLIRNILVETDYNLNYGSKDIIHDYLNNFGVVYGNYNATSGGTLKKVLIGQLSESSNVQFMMSKHSDTEYHTYSFAQDDLDNAQRDIFALPDGYIQVYKTVMVYTENENGQMEWLATRSFVGKAKTGYCVAERNKTVYSIRYESWVEI